MRPFSYYFGFRERVSRASYFATGLSLMAFKYAIDAGLIYATSGIVWTPFDYLVPLITVRAPKLALIRSDVSVILIAWTLPFLWIAVSMTMRRAVDAGRSLWHALWMFVPFMNYVAMLTLAVLPSSDRVTWNDQILDRPGMTAGRSAVIGTMTGVALALIALLGLAVMANTYGVALFLAVPFVMGVLVAFLYNRPGGRPLGATLHVVTLSLLAAGGAMLLFALEGLLCLAIAFPIALVVAFLGAAAGKAAANRTRLTPSAAALSVLAIPAAMFIDDRPAAEHVYEVVSFVEVAAPPIRVWDHVVAFSPITSRPELLFRFGLAYPVRATIEGSGVGALRRCEFSTGSFIEPITTWDSPRRLSFDVVDQPAPMRELSPYGRITPPHLYGFFRAVRGEFRLVALENNRTRLEGSTWYTLDLHPHAYWRPITDQIISRIHARVLEHIAVEVHAQSGSTASAPGSTVASISQR